MRARDSNSHDLPTSLDASAAACADESSYYWYELVELVKKLSLTTFVLFIDFDGGGANKFLRLVVGLLIALLGLTLQLITQPFKRRSDDALNCAVQLMLVLFFLLGMIIKLCNNEGADAIHNVLDAGVENTCITLVGIESHAEAHRHRHAPLWPQVPQSAARGPLFSRLGAFASLGQRQF